MRRELPAETDLLCASCGYIVSGLPSTGQCPECGLSIQVSTESDGRAISAYEDDPSTQSFVSTSIAIVLSPGHFFKTLRVRDESASATRFAKIHVGVASVFLSGALAVHLQFVTFDWVKLSLVGAVLIFLAGIPATAIFLLLTRRLVVYLTWLEARFWGMRLPRMSVKRVLNFHTAAYVPVWIIAILIVWGYRVLVMFTLAGLETITTYLYVLSAAVILTPLYLFRTYWTAMRSVMFANR